MRTSGRRLPLWVWWVPIVWIISFPWMDLTRAPQWDRVHLRPFSDPADRPRDAVANLVLFLPFGYSFARRRPPVAVLGAVAVAAFVSVSAEALQLYSRDRYPSGTDIVSGMAGALIAATLAVRTPENDPDYQTLQRPDASKLP